ncbi:MAG: extracellular solute-binding protein [Deltaproteobacteria bacterium]|nr:extracellular solute-binding protein [Deltaproteobacteria bacterium]
MAYRGRLFRRLFLIALIVYVAPTSRGSAAAAEAAKGKLAEMIKKAAREGEIVYQGPDPSNNRPTQEMLREMEAATEKHFGVKIRIKIDNALSYPASTAKTLTEIKAGAPPTFDLMYQTELSGAPLYKERALEPIPWLELFPFITPKDLEWNGLGIIRSSYVLMPVYNSRLIKPQDAPKKWDDFLNPKWKGKLGMPIYPDPWLILAQPIAWGEAQTFKYLSKIVENNPKLGRYPEVHERVLSGETVVTWLSERERTIDAKERLGTPVDVVEVESALLQMNVLCIPKGARRPNAAALVAAAMLTKEGQDLELKYRNLSSVSRPNTPAAEFAAKHRVITTNVDFILREGAELSKRIQGILLKKK